MSLNDWLIAWLCASLVFAAGFAVGSLFAEERNRERAEALARHGESVRR